MSEPLPSVPGAPRVPGVTLHHILGSGGSGTVYAGTDDETGHRVAVKLIDPAADRTASCATGFSVISDALVRLYRVGKVDGRSCVVMELCPGGTLEQQVQARGRLDLPEVVAILLGVAQGLEALHAKGLVHGDASPSNVVFTALGRPVLTDLEAIGRVGEPVPAERTDGYHDDAADQLTPAFDVYTLGALGWYMLTGEAPGPVTTRLPLPALRPDTPTELAELVVSCLSPLTRRPELTEVVRQLHELGIEPEPVRLQPVGPATDRQTVITARRRPAPSAVAAQERLRLAAERQREQEERRTTRQRRIRVGAGMVAAGVVLVGARVLTEPDRPAAATPTPSPTQTATVDPVAALTQLNRRREQAIARLDAAALTGVDAPGSPALLHDRELIRTMRSAGIRPSGLSVDLLWQTKREVTPTSATILLSSQVQAHRQVRVADGSVVRKVPQGKVLTTVVTLRRVGNGWRVNDVQAS